MWTVRLKPGTCASQHLHPCDMNTQFSGYLTLLFTLYIMSVCYLSGSCVGKAESVYVIITVQYNTCCLGCTCSCAGFFLFVEINCSKMIYRFITKIINMFIKGFMHTFFEHLSGSQYNEQDKCS